MKFLMTASMLVLSATAIAEETVKTENENVQHNRRLSLSDIRLLKERAQALKAQAEVMEAQNDLDQQVIAKKTISNTMIALDTEMLSRLKEQADLSARLGVRVEDGKLIPIVRQVRHEPKQTKKADENSTIIKEKGAEEEPKKTTTTLTPSDYPVIKNVFGLGSVWEATLEYPDRRLAKVKIGSVVEGFGTVQAITGSSVSIVTADKQSIVLTYRRDLSQSLEQN